MRRTSRKCRWPLLPSYRLSFARRSPRLHPESVLDIGCGTGAYTRVVLDADLRAQVEGIDLSENVIATARRELDHGGYGSRVDLHVGDVREWMAETTRRFDVVMLVNNVYYFDQGRRAELYRDLRRLLTERGQLIIVSMLAPGSVAAAHLHFMLTCQSSPSSLPGRVEMESDLRTAGLEIVANQVLVPTEPLVGLRAVRH